MTSWPYGSRGCRRSVYGRDALDVELDLQSAMERIRGPQPVPESDEVGRVDEATRPAGSQQRHACGHGRGGRRGSSGCVMHPLQEPRRCSNRAFRSRGATPAGVLSAYADRRCGRAARDAAHQVRRAAPAAPSHRGARRLQDSEPRATGRIESGSAVDTHAGRTNDRPCTPTGTISGRTKPSAIWATCRAGATWRGNATCRCS